MRIDMEDSSSHEWNWNNWIKPTQPPPERSYSNQIVFFCYIYTFKYLYNVLGYDYYK